MKAETVLTLSWMYTGSGCFVDRSDSAKTLHSSPALLVNWHPPHPPEAPLLHPPHPTRAPPDYSPFSTPFKF